MLLIEYVDVDWREMNSRSLSFIIIWVVIMVGMGVARIYGEEATKMAFPVLVLLGGAWGCSSFF